MLHAKTIEEFCENTIVDISIKKWNLFFKNAASYCALYNTLSTRYYLSFIKINEECEIFYASILVSNKEVSSVASSTLLGICEVQCGHRIALIGMSFVQNMQIFVEAGPFRWKAVT